MSTATSSGNPGTSGPAPAARRKRRRWWKVVLVIIILVFLLVLFTPTLLSTGPGKSFLLGQVNERIPGKVSADSISLGWFSGASARNLDYADQSKNVVHVDSLDTGVTLLNALTGATVPLQNVSVSGARLAAQPEVVIAVKLAGDANLGKKTLNFTGASEISATNQKSGSVTKVEIPAGSVASWGDLANDIHAVITYHLPEIQPLLAAELPEGTVLDGSYTMPLHVAGALSSGGGLRALRGITIDATKLGEGRIYMEGFDVGEAQVAYHMDKGVLTIEPTDLPFKGGGRIRVRGKIDFNANPPAFIIDTPDAPGEPFIKDVPLNHQIALGKLRFFPLLWGGGDKAGNLGEIGGKLNVRLDEVYIPLDAAAFKTKGTLKGSLSIHDLVTDAPIFSDALKQLGPVLKMTQPGLLNIRGGTIADVPFALADGKVSYQNLRLGTASANITFSGSVGLDDSLAMAMEVTARGVSIPIPIALKGTISKPEITVSMPAGGNAQDLGKDLQKEVPGLIDQFMKKK